ncbi:MAG: hypothetical protein AAGI50_11490 [Pseudomonadota bacterium]
MRMNLVAPLGVSILLGLACALLVMMIGGGLLLALITYSVSGSISMVGIALALASRPSPETARHTPKTGALRDVA